MFNRLISYLNMYFIFYLFVLSVCWLFQCRFNVKSKEQDCPNERYLLYQEWAHPKSFYKMQPLDLIR